MNTDWQSMRFASSVDRVIEAIANAEKMLDERSPTSPEIFYQKGVEI